MDKQNDYAKLNDIELMDRVRSGDVEAYSALWLRHKRVGFYTARSFSSSFDPEDVVAEAHSRIFKALQKGQGPTTSFRPYLVTTIQNIARRWGTEQSDTTVTDFDRVLDTEAEAEDDFTDASLNKMTLSRAFRSLPERWQQVLWHTEVEGGSTAELAESLELSHNAVSALTYRAKEGLRQAWIDAHLTQNTTAPECQYTIRHLGAYERNALSQKATARVEAHLAQCEKCSLVQKEARQVSHTLKSALLPTTLAGATAAVSAKTAFTSAPAAAAQTSVASASKVAAIVVTSVAALAGVAVVAATQFQAPLPPSETLQSSSSAQFEDAKDPEPNTTASANGTTVTKTKQEQAQLSRPTFEEDETIPGQETTLFFVTGPAAPYFHAEDGAVLTGPNTLITGSALPHAKVTLFVSGNRVGYSTQTVTANDAGGWEVGLSGAAEGEYVVRAYQTNGEGQRSALSSINYSVSWNEPEAIPVIDKVDTVGGTLTPLVSGTGLPGHTIEVLLNGISATGTVDADGTWNIQTSKGALAGANEVSAIQYSQRTKKHSEITDTVEFQLETPGASFVSAAPGSLELTVTSKPGTDVLVRDVDGGFSHTFIDTTGSDFLDLSWEDTGGSGSTTAVRVRYSADDGTRFGPVATIFAN